MKYLMQITLFLMFYSCGSRSNNPTTSASMYEAKIIPGLTASDVYGNFTNKGFELRKNIGSEFSSWTCRMTSGLDDYMVMASGSSFDEIFAINASYTFSGSPSIDGRDFIGYCASLPYSGAKPSEAKTWAMNNLMANADTTIGDVDFHTVVGEKIYSLKMYAR